MKLFVMAALAALLVSAGASRAAEAVTAPLRHLAFDLALEITYVNQQGGLRDVADPTGGGTVETQRGETHQSTIVCDIVAANPDGDLLVDVSETGVERSAPVSRLVLHLDGTYEMLVNQRPLTEEEAALVPFLARGYIGPQSHPLNDSWEVDGKLDKFTSKTKFHVTAVKTETEAIAFDEEYAFSGAEGFTGVGHGDVDYDPGKLVPERVGLFLTMRLQQMGHDTTVRYRANYTLKEDSFAKHG